MAEERTITLPFSLLSPEVRALLLQAAKDCIAADPDAMDKWDAKVKEIAKAHEVDANAADARARIDHKELFSKHQLRSYAGKVRQILMNPALTEEGLLGSPKITLPDEFLTDEVRGAIEAKLAEVDAHNEQYGLETHPHHKQARERIGKHQERKAARAAAATNLT